MEKRKRKSLVCKRCHLKKIKCNKEVPCSNCVRASAPCHYDQEALEQARKRAQPYSLAPLHLPTGSQRSHRPQRSSTSPHHDSHDPQVSKVPGSQSSPGPQGPHRHITASNGIYDGLAYGPRDLGGIPSGTGERLEGTNPYGGAGDTINFYEGYSSIHIKQRYRRACFGPLSWSALMQKDPGLKLLWDYTVRSKTLAHTALIFTNHDDMEDGAAVLAAHDSTEKLFEKRLLEPEGVADLVPYYKLLVTEPASQKSVSLGLSYGRVARELALIDKLEMYLPKQRVVWELLDIFFKDVYPFLPFLDEKCFVSVVESVIGPRAYKDEKITQFKIERKLDLAHFGILFVVLRLAYLTLFHNTTEAEGSSYLLANPISVKIVETAQECLDQFNMFRVPSLQVLQLATLMKFYHTYAPEDGDGADGGDSVSMIALLIQMATSFGCHREPDNVQELNKRDPLNNITRKIWHYMVCYDIKLGWTFGQPVAISRGSYDAKIPFYRKNEECLLDKQYDKFVTDTLYSNAIIRAPLRKILRLVLDVEGKVKIQEVCQMLTEIELILKKEYGDLANCLAPTQYQNPQYLAVTRAYMVKHYLELFGFTININFHLYQYYESKDPSISFHYIKKILTMLLSEFLPHYGDILAIGTCGLFVTPSFEEFAHKANLIFFSLLVRTNFIIHGLRSASGHASKVLVSLEYATYFLALCQLSSCMTRCLEMSVAVISKISSRYYYAWRITKGHTTLLDIVTSKQFFGASLPTCGHLSLPVHSLAELQELIAICEPNLARLGKETASRGDFFEEEFPAEVTPVTPETALDMEEIDRLWVQMLGAKELRVPSLDEMFG